MKKRRVIQSIKAKMKKYRYLLSQPNTYHISKRKLLKAYWYGFTPEEYVVYDLDRNSPKDYLSEYERYSFREQIQRKRTVVDNKITCYCLLRKFITVNTIYAYKLRGDSACTWLEQTKDIDGLLRELENAAKLVYKRISCGGGEGFKLLEYDDGRYFINREPCERADLERLLLETDDYLIEQYCVQSDFENELFPYAVNTVRLITAVHKDGTVEPLWAVQRIGIDAEKCVDNACAGGLSAEIDMNTGVMSVARSRATTRIGQVYEMHPATGVRIEGVAIPNWQSIVQKMVQLHSKLRFTALNYIAWDIALTNNGIAIIEANASCGMRILQTFGGQRNSKVGLWMKEWGYIK